MSEQAHTEQNDSGLDMGSQIEIRVGSGLIFVAIERRDSPRRTVITLDPEGADQVAGRLRKAANDLRSERARCRS